MAAPPPDKRPAGSSSPRPHWSSAEIVLLAGVVLLLPLLVLSLMLRRRYLSITIVLPLAVLQKESLLALAPIVFAHYTEVTTDDPWRRFRFLAALVLPGAITLLVVRAVIEPANSYSS